MERYLTRQVKADLAHKMVFVAGPRQVGKTTLARHILGRRDGYLSWDIRHDRNRILRQDFPRSKLWVFDELHKYHGWRNYLKGLFDAERDRHQILVTGSARLDFYRYGGDSLQGRYHFLRLHPLSVKELGIKTEREFLDLLTLGGFPEPFLGGSADKAQRWSREYGARLVREEITSLERVEDLGNLELLTIRLPELVGSPLSVNALREDLQLNHATVSKWLDILERLYGIFRVPPLGAPKIRAIKKLRKHYHFDWSIVPDESARFENLVAAHLLKWVHFQQDTKGRELELRYFRDVQGREVDFVVTERRVPIRLIECKWKDAPVDKSLRYLKNRFPDCEAYQISAVGKKDYVSGGDGIQVRPALKYLSRLV